MSKRGRGYSWPPFEPGNTAAQRHGGYSDRAWRPIAERLTARLLHTAPWLDRAAFETSVAAWARTEAQAQLVAAWLDEHGDLDEQGKPRPATVLLDRLEARVAKASARLGLDPVALLRIVREAAELVADPHEVAAQAGLADLLAQGRAALERRGAHELGDGKP